MTSLRSSYLCLPMQYDYNVDCNSDAYLNGWFFYSLLMIFIYPVMFVLSCS